MRCVVHLVPPRRGTVCQANRQPFDVLLATVQGIAAVVNGGIVDATQSEALVSNAIGYFMHGSRGIRSG